MVIKAISVKHVEIAIFMRVCIRRLWNVVYVTHFPVLADKIDSQIIMNHYTSLYKTP